MDDGGGVGPGGGDHDLYHYHDDNRQCNHDHGSHSREETTQVIP